MLKIGDKVVVSEDTDYDAPEFTTDFIFWDGTMFGKQEGIITDIIEDGPIFDMYGKLYRVNLPEQGTMVDGRDWPFPENELEVI